MKWPTFFALFAIVTTIMCGLVYVVVQHNIRVGANDPQIQMAEDAAKLLDQGSDAKFVISSSTVDIASSLASYTILYDQNGKVLESSATLDGATPVPPSGVFQYARDHGQNRVTWQPKPDVREAIVVVPFSGGYVLAGRSLREVEHREADLFSTVAAAWLLTLLASALTLAFVSRSNHKR